MDNGVEVLVTGGNGNLGSWISDYLASRGYTISILARTRNAFLENRDYAFIPCDLTDPEQVKEQLDDKKFQHVIHLSSANETGTPGYSELALRVNALGTRNLLQAIDKTSLKGFQYFSTFHVYGRHSGTIREATPPRPRHDYATTHLFAEYYVQQFNQTENIPYIIWRLSNSYGAPKYLDSSKWYLILNDLSRMAVEKREIKLNSNGLAQRDLIWMGDVCKVVSMAMEKKPGLNTVFNLGSGRSCRMLDIAQAVQDAYRERYGELLPINVNSSDNSNHDEPLYFDCGKLQKEFPHKTDVHFKSEADKVFDLLEISGS